jgi:hypothetical protein
MLSSVISHPRPADFRKEPSVHAWHVAVVFSGFAHCVARRKLMGAGSDVLFECPVGNLEALYCLVRLISSWSISGVGVKLLLSQ